MGGLLAIILVVNGALAGGGLDVPWLGSDFSSRAPSEARHFSDENVDWPPGSRCQAFVYKQVAAEVPPLLIAA